MAVAVPIFLCPYAYLFPVHTCFYAYMPVSLQNILWQRFGENRILVVAVQRNTTYELDIGAVLPLVHNADELRLNMRAILLHFPLPMFAVCCL